MSKYPIYRNIYRTIVLWFRATGEVRTYSNIFWGEQRLNKRNKIWRFSGTTGEDVDIYIYIPGAEGVRVLGNLDTSTSESVPGWSWFPVREIDEDTAGEYSK